MSINKAVACGLTGNEMSKKITGTDEVSIERTVVATGSGVAVGAVVSGVVVIGLGTVSAPVTIPLALASGVVSGIASLFD